MLEVSYVLTRQDLWAFQRFHLSRKKRLLHGFAVLANVAMVVVWVLLTLAFVQRMVLFSHVFGSASRAAAFWWDLERTRLMSWLLFTAYLVFTFWGSKWLAMHRAASDKHLSDRKTLSLTADGVRVTTRSQQSEVGWSGIPEILSDRQSLYFYVGPTSALIVPRRAFAAPETAIAFEESARRYQRESGMPVSSDAADGVWPPPPARAAPVRDPASDVEKDDAPGTVSIAYEMRRADLWRNSLPVVRRHPATLLNLLVPCLFTAVILVAFSHLLALPTFGIAFLVWLLLVWQWQYTIVARRLPDRRASRSCRSILRPDAFVDIMPEGRVVLPWREVERVFSLLGDLYLQRRDSGGSIFIPRTAFATPAEAGAFLNLMRQHCEAARKAPTHAPEIDAA